MSNIRVTYTGLISFIIGIVSVFTGLVFTIIVTRQLSTEEFGTWGLIGGLTGYVLMLNPVISYWTTREIARGSNSGKTSFLTSISFSFIAIIIYLIIISFFENTSNIDKNILFLAAIMIPAEFAKYSLTAISSGHKPQFAEYSLLIFEVTKIPLAIVLIYFFNMGLSGAIITTTIASSISSILLMIIIRDKLKSKFNLKYLKKWIRLFWIPIYPKISSILDRSDVVSFSIITGSVEGIAYWSAAQAVSRLVNHSSKMNKALYPKLLGGGRKEFLQENIVRVFYFAFPLTAMTIVFSKPALFILNPTYVIAIQVVLFLAPLTLLRTLNAVFNQALQGIEKVDTNETSTFKDYLKSKLFYLPTLVNIQRAIYLSAIIIGFLIMTQYTDEQLEFVILWAKIILLVQIPFNVYLYILIKRDFNPKFDFILLGKYFTASVIVFGITQIIMNEYLIYEPEILKFLPNFIPYVILSGVGYIMLTYLIDSKTRELCKLIINEIKNISR